MGLGNPAADKSVKDYLRLVTAEQLQTRITPKQATPFFIDKLTQLSLHPQRALESSKTQIDRFIVARDQGSFFINFTITKRLKVRTTELKSPKLSPTYTITNFNTNTLQTLTTGQHHITYKTRSMRS